MDARAHRVFRFARFVLDVTRGSLREDARELDLRPKSFEVLRHLVENADRLVTKDELLRSVWPNVVVTEDSLTRCVSEVRLALGDTKQSLIKNVPRRGYVFTAAVTMALPDPDLGLPLPDRPSIAVLPFANLAADPAQEYFSDGIAEDLITSLGRFSDLFVVGYESALMYKGHVINPKQIGHELGVRYLLQGSVRRDEVQLRITARLVEAGTGEQIWAEQYDRYPAALFAVQDEVTERIVRTLVTHITRVELDRAVRKPPETLDAHDHYLRGNALMRLREGEERGANVLGARGYYEQSIAADRNYARALQGLADTYVTAWLEPTPFEPLRRESRHPDAMAQALAYASRAVAADPQLPEAHATLGWVLHWQYRRAEAVVAFTRAYELNPNLADGRFGLVLFQTGRAVEAIALMKRIMRLDPFPPAVYYSYLGNAHYLNGEYELALEALRVSNERLPGYRPSYTWLAATAAQLGRREEARAAAAGLMRMDPGFSISWFLHQIRLARQEDADRLADGLRKAGLPD